MFRDDSSSGGSRRNSNSFCRGLIGHDVGRGGQISLASANDKKKLKPIEVKVIRRRRQPPPTE